MTKRFFTPLLLLQLSLHALPLRADNVVAHFRQAIATNTVPDARPFCHPLRMRQLEGERELLWQQWCQAATKAMPQQLFPIDSLAYKQSSVLFLPDSLEKTNRMPYYWGFKGDVHVAEEKDVANFLCLHGSGSREGEWAANYKWSMVYRDAPARYFIPQSPRGGEGCRWFHRSKQWAWRWLWLQMTTRVKADANRMYMFGISEGGYGSQRMASFYADYLAGVGPMAGGEPLFNAPPENLWHTAFSLLTGERDFMYNRNRLVPIAARQLDSLQALHPDGYKHRVELVPGQRHGFNYHPTTPWLRQHVRQLHPRQFAWEDYEMDGARRRGFYNVAVNARPSSSARLRYDMEIANDTVRLTVQHVEYYPIWQNNTYGFTMTLLDGKRYAPATGGELTVYLDERLVDMRRPVTVVINGRTAWQGKLKPNRRWMIESLTTFLDPERIYAAGVQVRY